MTELALSAMDYFIRYLPNQIQISIIFIIDLSLLNTNSYLTLLFGLRNLFIYRLVLAYESND